MTLPYLTDTPGIGGSIKQRDDDFFVQEIPLYEPSGQGEHVYCEIEKAGQTTFDAINRVASALGISSRDIGFAGMKDAQAVTRQILSIHGADEQAVMALQLPGIKILWAIRHGNKLRLGHLKANRFAIRIRGVNPTDVVRIRPIVDLLARRGVPNYFGEQRFGRRGTNHLLGAALIRGNDQAVLNLLLGSPSPEVDDAQSLGARKAFERGDFELAMKLYPRHCGMERRILHRFIRTGKPIAAVKAIDEKLRRLWVSALQSALFNAVLARRIQTIDQVYPGDLAMKEDNGAVFRVEDADTEQSRCQAFEISPTGPLLGYRMTMPEGQPLIIEQEVFAAYEFEPADLRVEGRLKVKGARRPLRVKPQDLDLTAGVDDHGPHITVAFTLPAGAFATVFLRELMKTPDPGDA